MPDIAVAAADTASSCRAARSEACQDLRGGGVTGGTELVTESNAGVSCACLAAMARLRGMNRMRRSVVKKLCSPSIAAGRAPAARASPAPSSSAYCRRKQSGVERSPRRLSSNLIVHYRESCGHRQRSGCNPRGVILNGSRSCVGQMCAHRDEMLRATIVRESADPSAPSK